MAFGFDAAVDAAYEFPGADQFSDVDFVVAWFWWEAAAGATHHRPQVRLMPSLA